MRSHAEELINTLASRQRGLVTRAQLLRVGLTPGTVKSGVKARRLRPVHRGVYQVGPVVAPNAEAMAAVLACGLGAVVSHRSAAALWHLLPPPVASAPTHVIVPGRNRGHGHGIRVHRVRSMEPEDVTHLEGVPITTPTRTLLDLASTLGSRELEQALARAERARLTSRDELAARVNGHSRRGLRSLRALLQDGAPPAMTRSDAEEQMLALARKGELPRPELNVRVCGREVDFFWRAERLVLQVDGFAFHASRSRFEGDRLLDAKLAAKGIQVMRVTWLQITSAPEAVIARLAQALALADRDRERRG